MDYSTFMAQYGNKRNPLTGMYYTQADAARQAGVDPAQVTQWMNQAGTTAAYNAGQIPDAIYSDRMGQYAQPPAATPGYANLMGAPERVSGRVAATPPAAPMKTMLPMEAEQRFEDIVPPYGGSRTGWLDPNSPLPRSVTGGGGVIGGGGRTGDGSNVDPSMMRDPYEAIARGAGMASLGGGAIASLTNGGGSGSSLPAAVPNAQLDPLMGSLYGYYSGLQGAVNPAPGVKGNLEGLYGGTNLQGAWNALMGNLYGGAENSTNYLLNQGIWPGMMANLNYLNQAGLPGNQQLQQEQAALGLKGLAGQLLGGQEGGYGVSDFLSQVLGGGLPGQGTIEGLVPGQAGFGTGMQGEASKRILEALGGGGLTQEYVDAARRRYLEPQLESQAGNFNRMTGGVASPDSGLAKELARRTERDFMDRLIMQGGDNYQNLIGQAAGLGQGGINTALSAFGAVPGAVSPFAQLMGNLGSDALSQSLGRFSSGGALGLQNLNTIAGIGMQPYSYGLQAQGQSTNQLLQALNQLLGGANQYLGGQQQFNLGLADLPASLIRSFLSGEQQKSIAEMQRDIASKQLLGQGIGAVAANVPAILKALGII